MFPKYSKFKYLCAVCTHMKSTIKIWILKNIYIKDVSNLMYYFYKNTVAYEYNNFTFIFSTFKLEVIY